MMAYQVFGEDLFGFGQCTIADREEESTVQSNYSDLIRSKTTHKSKPNRSYTSQILPNHAVFAVQITVPSFRRMFESFPDIQVTRT